MSATFGSAEYRPSRVFQAQDFAWLVFVAVLVATMPETNYNATILFIVIGAFQIVEPRIRLLQTRRGQIFSIFIKLLLSYLLIGWSHAILSHYFEIFLLPIVSAAALFEWPGVVLVTLIASVAYPSFLLFLDWNSVTIATDDIQLLCLRVSFYAIVAFVVYQQARAKRGEMIRTQQAAERLAESNRNLRAAEASLRRSERLAALGQLTAGLAHELRNPLGTIKASAEMLQQATTRSQSGVMDEMTGFISSEVDRMNGLISSFLNFARPLEVHPVVADLGAVVDEVIRVQSELARQKSVQIISRVPHEALSFEFDPDLMRMALANLVQNAMQASESGQIVEVRGEATDESITLSVIDQGKGIEPQNLESIFNPFFTTRPDGVGLGLAIVSKIVGEHEGRIQVRSQPGKGTTFEITLPLKQ